MTWDLFCALVAALLGLVVLAIVLWPARPRDVLRVGPNRKHLPDTAPGRRPAA